jgi:hypothetical protein
MRLERVVRHLFVQEWRHFLNYRGIFILSVIPKLFEKLICDVITQIIRSSISEELEQHGLVGGCSTLTSLVKFSNFVLSEMKGRLSRSMRFRQTFRRLSIG